MSLYFSANDDGISVDTSKGVGNGKSRSRIRKNQENDYLRTMKDSTKTFGKHKRKDDTSNKLHRLSLRSPRSLLHDELDNFHVKSNGCMDVLASPSDRGCQFPATTPKKNYPCEIIPAMEHNYSMKPSTISVVTVETPSTVASSFGTGSIASSSKMTNSSKNFSTFFSHSGNVDFEIDNIYEKEKDWRADSDEESQSIMSMRASLIAKLFRDEMQLWDGTYDKQDDTECNMSSDLCKSACSWSMWICMWILFFAVLMSFSSEIPNGDSDHNEVGEIRWIQWDRIRYASSIFWTVGGVDYPGRYGHQINNYHRIVTCVFMAGSLGFTGFALGHWGDALIRTYDATFFQSGDGVWSNDFEQKDNVIQRNCKRARHRRQESVSDDQERRKHQRRYQADNKETNSYYGSIPSSSLKHRSHQFNVRDRFNITDYSDDETDCTNCMRNVDGENCFTLFPNIHWLFLQALILTTLSMLCVTFIRRCEQREQLLQVTGNMNSDVIATAKEIGFDNLNHKWSLVSTFYYALSTATTSGLRNASEPVSVDGKLFALLFEPLSVITSLHWMVFIAQIRIQKSQREWYEMKKRTRNEGQHFDEDSNRFDMNAKREIALVTDTSYNTIGQNGVVNDGFENDEDDSVRDLKGRQPVSPASKETALMPSLDTFYELELQRMGLVDIETFRVLKRNYALEQRRKL